MVFMYFPAQNVTKYFDCWQIVVPLPNGGGMAREASEGHIKLIWGLRVAMSTGFAHL